MYTECNKDRCNVRLTLKYNAEVTFSYVIGFGVVRN